ncbi:AF4/FMR2 family member 4-like isoform X2 [Xenia sp. Carnegie-2017]|nr:AF4/FMR2 family member 4-like isoform X2 [Xenia sp. Carnegie-2017]
MREINKSQHSPLFPPPRKVNDSCDEITKTIKKSLGEYSNFVQIMKQEVSREKAPGQTCIGVMPVPSTPTDNKTHPFPLAAANSKSKGNIKEKSFTPLNQERCKTKAVEKTHDPSKCDEKPKLDPKHRPNFTDANRPKHLKLGEKLHVKRENGHCNDAEKTSFSFSLNKHQQSSEKEDVAASDKISCLNGIKSEPLNGVVCKNETYDTSSEEPVIKVEKCTPPQKIKPTPLPLLNRKPDSSSMLHESPQRRDEKVQTIFKEMTEPVNMPLTEICTPLPRKDLKFPFPTEKESNQNAEEVSNSLKTDLDTSDEDDSDDERTLLTRSGSSSSSSSSSSGESSDSELDEDVGEKKPTSEIPAKPSMLNSPPEKTVSPPVRPLLNETKQRSPEGKNDLQLKTSSESFSNDSEDKSRTSGLGSISNVRDTKAATLEEKSPRKDVKIRSEKLNGSANETVATIKSHHESSPSSNSKTVVRIKVEKESDDRFKVKSDVKGKHPTRKKSESENSKPNHEIKSNMEKTHSSELNSTSSTKLDTNVHKLVNGFAKVRTKDEKAIRDKKLNSCAKKLKRTHDSSQSLKEKSDDQKAKDKIETSKSEHISNNKLNSPKNLNKPMKKKRLKKASERTDSLGFDCCDIGEEDSVIDVVGDSPVTKKKRTNDPSKHNRTNGIHKNGLLNVPVGIQLLHDKEKDPSSLIVKIPLSFIKRIPNKFDKNLSIQNNHSEAYLNGENNCSGKKNGDNGDMEVNHYEENEKRGVVDKERTVNLKKRMHHDGQREKVEQKKRKTTAELNADCEADIRKDDPDSHLLRAKTLKREADNLTDKEAKSRTYVEAIVSFICCGRALEDKEDGDVRAGQMYSETTELLKFILKHILGKTEDKRLLFLCMKIQSLLLHKLYRMKGKHCIRNTQILSEHFKTTQKSSITSPYTNSHKHGSTPSPMSPTPSPAGSVGSIGSNGSNSGGESNHTGRHHTSSVTSPVSVSIPQRIHGVMAQHVSTTSKLVYSIDLWDRATNMSNDYQDFFAKIDDVCGSLTFHSSIAHVVNYAKNSLSIFHEDQKGT